MIFFFFFGVFYLHMTSHGLLPVLKKVAFAEHTQITWSALEQALRREFQLSISSTRPLTPEDFDYIKQKIGTRAFATGVSVEEENSHGSFDSPKLTRAGGETVSQSTFSAFWTSWYGPIMKALYQKHGHNLWRRRYVFYLCLVFFFFCVCVWCYSAPRSDHSRTHSPFLRADVTQDLLGLHDIAEGGDDSTAVSAERTLCLCRVVRVYFFD
jgi:hypothetical protein